MEREIKFRGQRTDTGEWVYGHFFESVEGVRRCYNIVVDRRTSYYCDCNSISQFTGLKDKNGKDIYEGDQLHVCAGYTSKVAFEDGMFVSIYKHPEDGETLPLLDVIGKETEVIEELISPTK